MTEEQKNKLSSHVAWHKPISMDVSKVRWLEDEEVIELTGCSISSYNARFEINNDDSREIWYSQLSVVGLTDKLDLCQGYYVLKGQNKLNPFRAISASEFWELAKGKKFRVDIYTNVPYTFNRKSELYKRFKNYKDLRDYVCQCVNEDKYDDIDDLLKTSSMYQFTEI